MVRLLPEQLPQLTAFLSERFSSSAANDPFLHPRQLHWKYFEPRPDWLGARSYVTWIDGEIVAHGCVVPSRIPCKGGEVNAAFVIDWCASPRYPGVGHALLAEITELVGVRLSWGGSGIVRKIIKRTRSFSKEKVVPIFRASRIIRPFRQLQSTGFDNRSPLRLLRDMARNISHPVPSSRRWQAVPVQRFDGQVVSQNQTLVPGSFALPVRTPQILNYMLACPTANIKGYLVSCAGVPKGHLLLSGVRAEVRIADLQIEGCSHQDWAESYMLAIHTAVRDFPKAAIVRTILMPKLLQTAGKEAGFTIVKPEMCLIEDLHNALDASNPPALAMMDADSAYL